MGLHSLVWSERSLPLSVNLLIEDLAISPSTFYDLTMTKTKKSDERKSAELEDQIKNAGKKMYQAVGS